MNNTYPKYHHPVLTYEYRVNNRIIDHLSHRDRIKKERLVT